MIETETKTRKAVLKSNSYDPASRTFEAVAATQSAVKMGNIREILLCNDAAIDLERMPLPILADHRTGSLDNQLGTWISARCESGRLILTGKLGHTQTAERIAKDLADGHSFGVSVGYTPLKFTDQGNTRTVHLWSVHEASLTSVAADPEAKTRSTPSTENERIPHMEPENQTVSESPAPQAPQSRAAQIRSLGNRAGVASAIIDGLVDDPEITVEQASRTLLENLPRSPVISNIREAKTEEPGYAVRSQAEALSCRSTGEAPSDHAKPYMDFRIYDHAKDCLKRDGVETFGLSNAAVIERAMHVTSDFPELLTGEGRRELASGYQIAASEIKRVAKKSTAQDFRDKQRLSISDYEGMQELSESGEFKSVSRSESKSSYRLKTFGAMTSISVKALINDDLNAFDDWAFQAGRMAGEMEAKELVTLLESNPTIEGSALWHSSRSNLADSPSGIYLEDTAGNIDLSPLKNARYALRMMKGLDGSTPIAAVPKFILVHPARETEAEEALAQIQATKTADVNVMAGKLDILVEPRLTDDSAWYVFADPAQLPVFEYAFLSGEEGPQVASQAMFNQLGMSFRVHEHFGCGVIDWRGSYLNAGD